MIIDQDNTVMHLHQMKYDKQCCVLSQLITQITTYIVGDMQLFQTDALKQDLSLVLSHKWN